MCGKNILNLLLLLVLACVVELKGQAEQSNGDSLVQTKSQESPKFDSNFNCIEHCGVIESLPKDCDEALKDVDKADGVFVLNVPDTNLPPFGAYCARQHDTNTSCTVMQRRQDGSVDFYKNWDAYKAGFGNLTGEYWLGLDRIHALTLEGKHELVFEMITVDGKNVSEKYKNFQVEDEKHGYRLSIEKLRENVYDFLEYDGRKKFSTFDRDNDIRDHKNCAAKQKSAWWFSGCSLCNFNGEYKPFDRQDDSGLWCLMESDEISLRYLQISVCPSK